MYIPALTLDFCSNFTKYVQYIKHVSVVVIIGDGNYSLH
jgi:hypothetical protein